MGDEHTISVTLVCTSSAVPGLNPVVLVTVCFSDIGYLSAISNLLVQYSSV